MQVWTVAASVTVALHKHAKRFFWNWLYLQKHKFEKLHHCRKATCNPQKHLDIITELWKFCHFSDLQSDENVLKCQLFPFLKLNKL